MVPLCIDQGIGVIPWSPLARGRLTREWGTQTTRSQSDAFGSHLYRETEEADRRVINALGTVADRSGRTRAQVALGWLLSKPGVTSPIIGATKRSHLEDALAALEVKLSEEDIAEIEAPYVPHLVAGFA
jgi:1-deoxyxylulose-5-phosphate synthase